MAARAGGAAGARRRPSAPAAARALAVAAAATALAARACAAAAGGAGEAAADLELYALGLAADAGACVPAAAGATAGAGGGDSSGCGLQLLQRRAQQRAAAAAAAAREEPASRLASAAAPGPLLQAGSGSRPKLFGAERAAVLAGSSVYFAVIDRFARDDGNNTACNDAKHWCGGTLRGLLQHLDYIADMGFDCLWITPVVKQYEGETEDGTGFMGYWAKNFYEVDPHYGTGQDLKELVEQLHARNMTIMLDIVTNHVGPVHSARDVEDIHPFNRTSSYHTLGIGDLSFDEYTRAGGKKPGDLPLQAMWSGAQCPQGERCNCFTCEPMTKADFIGLPPPAWDACPYGKMVWNASSPCPWNLLSAFCMPGDYGCQGYSEKVTLEGWFYDLGDLNQSVPFVRDGLLRWARWMVETYDLDMLRLDTAAFQPFDFLAELQDAVGVPIIGEVTTTNVSYHASIQGQRGRPGLDGVLNFPLYYAARAAFCHTWFPRATGNLTFLAQRMIEQAGGIDHESPYRNLDTLGNFVDNHDEDRLYYTCKGDAARMLNAITWAMLVKGVPIIYYGTETLYMKGQRDSFWNYNFTRGRGFHFLKVLNQLRRDYGLGTAPMKVMPFVNHQKLTITRGENDDVWVYLNNMESGDEVVRYCSNAPQPPKPGYRWCNYFTGQEAFWDSEACLRVRDNVPVVLVQRKEGDNKPGWEDTWVKPTPPPQGKDNVYDPLG